MFPDLFWREPGSAIYYYDNEQKKLAEATRDHFNEILKSNGRGPCTTEIEPAPEYFIAEQYRKLTTFWFL